MNTALTLSDDSIRLAINPTIGGSFLAFAAQVDGRWVDIMRPTPAQFKTSSDTASFLMAPYPNRIREGKFSFEGRTYQLQFPEKHSIHGDVRNRPWSVVSAQNRTVTLHMRSRDFSDMNFPFAFSATQSFETSNGTLTVRCSIRNEHQTPIPVGCGYHPYFNRALANKDEDVQLRFVCRGVYPSQAEVPLPTGMPIPLPDSHNFSKLRELDVNLDVCYGGWDGAAEMVWPKSKVKVTMRASSTMSHLVLFSPPGKPFFALEPQTQMTDGFNFLARGEQETGVAVLQPGNELSTWFSLSVEEIP